MIACVISNAPLRIFVVAPSRPTLVGVQSGFVEGDPTTVQCIVQRVKPSNVTFNWSLEPSGTYIPNYHIASRPYEGAYQVFGAVQPTFWRTDNRATLRCQVRHGTQHDLMTETSQVITVFCTSTYHFITENCQNTSHKFLTRYIVICFEIGLFVYC